MSPPIEPLELNEPCAAMSKRKARRAAAIVGGIRRKRRWQLTSALHACLIANAFEPVTHYYSLNIVLALEIRPAP
jgi:hypothetical protein